MDYAAMTTAELRNKAREARNAGLAAFADVSGLQIAGMKREELLARFSGAHVAPEAHETAKTEPGGNGGGPNNGGANDTELINLLAQALGSKIKMPDVQLDEEKVTNIVQVYVSNVLENYKNENKKEIQDIVNNFSKLVEDVSESMRNMKKEIIVKKADMPDVDCGTQHIIFEKILKRLVMRKNVFLVGPSGSGKTHIAKGLAKALNLDCYYMLVGEETSKADFFGYLSVANGQYIETDFYRAYKNGGLILIDEIDAGNAGVMTMLNMALDNGVCCFPCGMVQRHKDFVCIASGNTYGRGSDKIYCGRNPLDGATLQRFKVMYMDYDEDLERALCPDQKWVKKIHKLRKIVSEHRAKIIVSMRPIVEGYEMKLNGISEEEILDETVFQGYNSDAVSTIKSALGV